MQRVEVHGLQYLSEAELLKQLAVDTTYSIWTDLGPLQKRLTLHPQLLSVTLSRKLPGTLVIRVEERQPLALVPGPRGFVAVDDSGAAVPVDPSRGTIDVPILQAADTTVLRLLAAVRDSEPALFGRISEIERVGTNELDIHLREVRVLAMSDITLTRLLDILPVERDLASKGMRVAELDLRYSGQVIARQVRKR
jgi:cell division protein FtsQ